MDGEGWRFGPVRVAARPHPPGQRGEPAVRPLLAQWLGRDEVPLVRDAHGRPRLLAPFQDCDASWSHSGGLLLLACADDDPAAPLRLLACDPALGAPADWRLHEWTPQPDYVAVLAWRPAGG